MIVTAAARAAELLALGYENNPFFAWDNLGAVATLSGTDVLTDGQRENAVTGSTYDRWRPDVTGTTARLEFDFGSAVSLNFAAICAHNLSDFGGSVAVQNSADAITWADAGAGSVTPTDNSPIAWRMADAGTARRYWRFNFTSLTAGDLLSVGVAFMGDELVMPMRIYQGFAPRIVATNVELQSNVSEGGNLLGSSAVRSGSSLELPFTIIGDAFVRGDFKPFMSHFNTGGGAFVAWRPTKYPEDVHYGWRDGPVIRPENGGPRSYMSLTVKMRLHDG